MSEEKLTVSFQLPYAVFPEGRHALAHQGTRYTIAIEHQVSEEHALIASGGSRGARCNVIHQGSRRVNERDANRAIFFGEKAVADISQWLAVNTSPPPRRTPRRRPTF